MREIRKLISAGGEEYVDAAGDFIFCSFADRNVLITIEGQPVTVKAGDKVRPQKRIRDFLIRNPDPENPVAVTLVVGEGDYNSQLIQGQVTVMPGIRGADGEWRDDTRHEVTLDLYPIRTFAEAFPPDVPVKIGPTITPPPSGNESVTAMCGSPSGFVLATNRGDPNYMGGAQETFIRRYDFDFNLIESYYPPQDNRLIVQRMAEWRGKLFFVSGGGAPGGLGRITSDPVNFLSFHQFSGAVTGMAVINDELHAFTASEYLIFSNPENGAEYRTVNYPAWASGNATGMEQNRTGEIVIFTYDAKIRFIDPQTLEVIKTVDRVPALNVNNEGFGAMGRFYAAVDNSETLKIFPFEEVVEPGQFIATKGGCADLTRKESRFITAADVEMVQGSGLVTLRGEVIRATLEQYLGRELADGYMDHVYSLAASTNVNGGTETKIVAGARSLQARGIEDDLQIYLPARITVEIDDDLPTL